MNYAAAPAHIAVVPVGGLDLHTQKALVYAANLTPRVVAIHVRDNTSRLAERLEASWALKAPEVPLVIIDAAVREWPRPFMHALAMLQHDEQAERITVVMPQGSRSGAGGLRLALAAMPGVAVVSDIDARSTPPK